MTQLNTERVRLEYDPKVADEIDFLRALLDRINNKAVQLREEIGTGPAVAELRDRIHNIVELSRQQIDN